MISGPTLRKGCLALTLSKRAPDARTERASISHCHSSLRNQRDAEQSGRSRCPDLSLSSRISTPPDVLPAFPSLFHIQPISVTRQKRASSCLLGDADFLERAQGWSFFLFSLFKPKISNTVTKWRLLFACRCPRKASHRILYPHWRLSLPF